ncbi:MAG: histidine phosphatase family protein [Ruminococcaceae bacterium]|nr:histidine phosphatase family protein [Oscillospiraceae bacterium]
MKTFKIHLIRHGLTDANILGKYIGSKTDLPLCPEGVDELRMLRESVDYPRVERLYSSPMLRARQTAGVLYPDMDVNVVDSLIEYDFGDFEGKSAQELEVNTAYTQWTSGKIDAPPNGESTTDFIKRLCLGLNQIVQDMMMNNVTNAAVMMHGGAIMMLLAACAVPRRRSVEWTSENGRGYSLLITPSLYHSSGIVEVYDVI